MTASNLAWLGERLDVETEYAVRYQLYGERQRIDPVGDPEIGADFIEELRLKHGVTGVLVSRQITAWEEM